MIAAAPRLNYISSMDTIRIAERLSEGGVFTEDRARRLATTLADHLKDEFATKHDLDVLETRLKAEFKTDPARAARRPGGEARSAGSETHA